MVDDIEAAAEAKIRSSRAGWVDSGAASDGDVSDDGGSESGGESEDGATEGPDAAELMAKIDALGAGLGSAVDAINALHAKVDQVGAVLSAALGAVARRGI